MPEEQIGEVFELVDGEVRGQSCLLAFFANDADTDISSEDHADIVAAVADAESLLVGVELDLLSDVGFLRGGAAAADDSTDATSECEEHLLERLHHRLDGESVDDQDLVALVVDVVAELV